MSGAMISACDAQDAAELAFTKDPCVATRDAMERAQYEARKARTRADLSAEVRGVVSPLGLMRLAFIGPLLLALHALST